jgi:hypothetical protein
MFEPRKIIDRTKIAKEKGLILDPNFEIFTVNTGLLFEINKYFYDGYDTSLTFLDHKTRIFKIQINNLKDVKINRYLGLKYPLKILDDNIYSWMAEFILIQDLKEKYTIWDELSKEELLKFKENVIELIKTLQNSLN